MTGLSYPVDAVDGRGTESAYEWGKSKCLKSHKYRGGCNEMETRCSRRGRSVASRCDRSPGKCLDQHDHGRPDRDSDKSDLGLGLGFVCDPLPDMPFFSGASVTVHQANGKQVSTGTGGASTFSGPNAPFLTCDGVTANTAVVQVLPDPGSGPFKGGGAVVTARFDYQTPTGSESGSTLATVRLRG